jgi:hypothetical protein
VVDWRGIITSFEKDVPRVGNAYFWVDDPRVVGLLDHCFCISMNKSAEDVHRLLDIPF